MKYIETYFRIESGYMTQRLSTPEQFERFSSEVKSIFLLKNCKIEEIKHSNCFYVIDGKTRLYCHPQSLSGPCREKDISYIAYLLSRGKSFQYLRTDLYKEIYDMTKEQELNHYRSKYGSSIETGIIDLCKDNRKNPFKNKQQLLEHFAKDIHVETFRSRHLSDYRACVSYRYVSEIYDSLEQRGLLSESCLMKNSENSLVVPQCINTDCKSSICSNNN